MEKSKFLWLSIIFQIIATAGSFVTSVTNSLKGSTGPIPETLGLYIFLLAAQILVFVFYSLAGRDWKSFAFATMCWILPVFAMLEILTHQSPINAAWTFLFYFAWCPIAAQFAHFPSTGDLF